MPVSPAFPGCKAKMCFCFLETKFLAGTEKGKVLKQEVAPTKRLHDIKINRVPKSPTKTPTIEPVEVGYSRGRRTRHFGRPSQY